MKIMKRFLSVSGVLMLMLAFSTLQAQNRNDVLFYQSVNDGFYNAVDEVSLSFFQDWRKEGVKKIRTQEGEDTPGTYRSLTEFDGKGNVARVEAEDGRTHTVSYDKSGNMRRIRTYQLSELYSTEYFYYSRNGDLKKSTLRMEKGSKEFERFYDDHFRLVRQRKYQNGISTKTLAFQWTYDEDGNVLGMSGPGRKVNCFYEAGNLVQVRTRNGGENAQVSLSYGEHGPETIKVYVENDGDLILSKVTSILYNNAGIVARMKEQGRDKNLLADITNFYYDGFNNTAVAHRGDWDGGGYGYGTPVLIEWARPDYDQLVTDSMQVMKLSLKPGINQSMPEIKEMSLRLNHKLSEKEIGEVVLKKIGETNEWYIEEALPLTEGRNTIFLEVETELGRFSSGERYITYKNPNRQIKVRDLHILAVGIEDYNSEKMTLGHVSKDINAIVSKLQLQEGKMFNDVRTKTLMNGDATKQNIEDAIRKMKGQAASEDLVLIYFSGHGEEMDGNFYLKPSDVAATRSNLAETAIDNRWVLEEISRYNASTLFFMDASHDLNAGDEEKLDIGSANMDEVKEDFETVIDGDEDIRIFMSSTSSKQKAIIGNEHSHFAMALIEGIEGKADATGNNNGYVTVNELSDFVSDRVLGLTDWKQKPTTVKRGVGLVPIAKVK